MSHAEAMYRWMLDPVVSRNVGLRVEPSLEKTREWIARASQTPAVLALAIYREDRHIGNVVFDQISEDGSSSRLSIYIGEPGSRDQGLGTVAMRAALTRAFTERGFRTIWLTVNDDNARARHVYTKLGFRMNDYGRMELSGEDWLERQQASA